MIFVFAHSISCFCQNYREQIEALQNKQAEYDILINNYKDSIKLINDQIVRLSQKSMLAEAGVIIAIVQTPTYIVKEAKDYSQKIGSVNKGDSLIVHDYLHAYFLVTTKDPTNKLFGWVFRRDLYQTDLLFAYRENADKTRKEKQKLEQEKKEREEIIRQEQQQLERDEKYAQDQAERVEREAQEQAEKKAMLESKFGKTIAQKILDGYIWLGMTTEIARLSWGEPNDINKSVGSWGVHEQWVYNCQYLYFENGILTSWQD